MRALLIVALNTLALTSAAVQKYSYSTKGFGAYADAWFDTESSYGYITVWGSAMTDKSGKGKPVKNNYASVSYYEYDYFAGESIYGYGETSNFAGSFKTSGSTGPVTIELTREFCSCDYNCTCTYEPFGTITVTTVWTPSDEVITRGHSSWTSRGFDFMYKSRFNGSYRYANVLITVEKDGETTNVNDAYGEMSDTNSGSMDIYRGY